MNSGLISVGRGTVPDVALGNQGENALLTAPNRQEQPFNLVVDESRTFDVSNLRAFSVVYSAVTGSSVVAYEISFNGVNWFGLPVKKWESSVVTRGTFNVSVSALHLGMLLGARWFRVRQTSGISCSGTLVFTSQIAELNSFPMETQPVVGTGVASSDSLAASGTVLNTLGTQYGYVGGASSVWERVRVPNFVKSATATASGDTALWTPTSGRKFRLMRYQIQITSDSATSGGAVIDIVLRDATTALAPSFSCYVPAVAGTAFGNTSETGWCDVGNGILSAAANNVLNINLSATLTSGKVRVVVAGTEE